MKMTVGKMKAELAKWPDNCELTFGLHTFYRLKPRGAGLVDVEFNESCRPYTATKGTARLPRRQP